MTRTTKRAVKMKIMKAGLLGVAILSVAAGCDGRTIVGTPGSGGSGATGSGGATGGGGAIDGGPQIADGNVPDTCPVAGGAVTPTTVDGMRAALSRRWLLCSPLGLTHEPQAGIEITTGDRFFVLVRDAATNLTPMHGADFEGAVDYLATSGVQVDFTKDAGGSVASFPVITQNPTMLIINNNGVYEYRYVAADGP